MNGWLDLCTNLSAPACNAQLLTPLPKSSVNETAAATTTVRQGRMYTATILSILFCELETYSLCAEDVRKLFILDHWGLRSID
ncbi:hypothetical protein T265_06304 [Opisthorchis viverrini]|uniref:Uncharacterized protein n=1 Tax=Opisthorchis viverrini TaxID=6198 RepID=A0A074ZGW9_OPIVI|nr:hypothetical protein T265_06304 [Opisthorchis viverrini]KER26448.1 hypothetical protein T265_06304 [Opisthorchis viverrini]